MGLTLQQHLLKRKEVMGELSEWAQDWGQTSVAQRTHRSRGLSCETQSPSQVTGLEETEGGHVVTSSVPRAVLTPIGF